MARIPKDPYKARLAEFKKEQKALKRIEKFKAKAQKERDREATAERKRLEKIEKLRKETELRHAKAAKTEAIARQRKANIQAHKLHPLGIGKKSVFGKSKGRRSHGKPWYDLV